MRFKPVAIVICAISLIFVTGCSSKPAAVEMIESVDAISISASASPEYSRVVALANGSAEIIASLGHSDILIGRDIASDLPSLKSVEVVTSGHQIIAEKILSLKPDLLLIDASSGPSSAIAAIESTGIRIVKISEAWTLNEIDRKVSEVAGAIGAIDDGKLLIAALQSSTSVVKQIRRGETIAFLYLRRR
jgi:iron complex transport system substrate-binding protein